jgi:hypothetical protein
VHFRQTIHAHNLIVVDIRLLDGAIFGADALSKRQAKAIDDTAPSLCRDIVRLIAISSRKGSLFGCS